MAQFLQYPLSDGNGANQMVNDQMFYSQSATVSNDYIQQPFRKRQLSEQNINASDENEHKKFRQQYQSNMSSAPINPTQTDRLESLILQLSSQLSSNINSVSEKLEKRLDELETNFEDRVSEKLSEKISGMIDHRIKEKLDEVRTEVKSDMIAMQARIDGLEKSLSDVNSTKENDTRKNRFIIKNLDFDENEKNNDIITTNKVQAMLKDGLALSNVVLKSVTRKESKGRAPGLVIVEVVNFDNKREIMKNKKSLRNIIKYSKVYIENDLPQETRNFQASVRTVLKEIGSEKSYRFSGNRLIKKH